MFLPLKIAKTSLLSLFGNATKVLVSFLVGLLASRWLGSTDYGLFNLALGYTVFFNYLLTFGLDITAPYFTVQKHLPIGKTKEQFFSTVMAFSGIGCLVIGGIALILLFSTRKHFEPRFFWVLVPILVSTFFWAFGSICSGLLRGYEIFYPAIFREQFILPILQLAALLVAVNFFGSLSVVWYSALFSIANILATAYVLVTAYRKHLFKVSAAVFETSSFIKFLRLTRQSLPNSITCTLEPLLTWTGILVVGALTNPSDVGVYTVCQKATLLMSFFGLAISPVFTTYIADHFAKGHPAEMLRIINSFLRLCTKWSAITLFLLVSASDYFLKLFGKEYAESSSVLLLLLIGGGADSVCTIFRQALIVSGKGKINVFIMAFGSVLNLGASVLLTRFFGLNGAALAFSLSLVFIASARAYFVLTSFTQRRISFFSVLKSLFILLFFVGLASALRLSGLAGYHRLILAISFGSISFLVLFSTEIKGLFRERAKENALVAGLVET